MLVLDSDFIIHVFRKDSAVAQKLDELEMLEEPIATTVFNAHEVCLGAAKTKTPSNIDKTLRLVTSLNILNYDLECMHHAVELIRFLEEKGQIIGIFDELVASVCLANNATLLTRNTKHFSRVPGLKITSW